ncbi:hypothetical protein GMJLKIPL_3746 [Methylobacterium isbiliense]|uniref:Uncharacterized protein n=1 Tax=Methylobacterium isbiliense TaxID=315478 RepID=A0ABQ4SH39_9HYPH|nr:hypothetical protein GMJLKIPL_3746 [Methylobacterium isbiliense]
MCGLDARLRIRGRPRAMPGIAGVDSLPDPMQHAQ